MSEVTNYQSNSSEKYRFRYFEENSENLKDLDFLIIAKEDRIDFLRYFWSKSLSEHGDFWEDLLKDENFLEVLDDDLSFIGLGKFCFSVNRAMYLIGSIAKKYSSIENKFYAKATLRLLSQLENLDDLFSKSQNKRYTPMRWRGDETHSKICYSMNVNGVSKIGGLSKEDRVRQPKNFLVSEDIDDSNCEFIKIVRGKKFDKSLDLLVEYIKLWDIIIDPEVQRSVSEWFVNNNGAYTSIFTIQYITDRFDPSSEHFQNFDDLNETPLEWIESLA